MSEDNKDKKSSLGIGHLPKWKQIVMVVALVVVGIGGVEFAKSAFLGGSEAQAYKAKLQPLAEQLERAQKTGDVQAAVALLDPTTKIVNYFNDLDDAKKTEINQKPLHYCILAAINLSGGVVEVVQTGAWTSKSQYEAAMDICK